MRPNHISRRQFLRRATTGAAALLGGSVFTIGRGSSWVNAAPESPATNSSPALSFNPQTQPTAFVPDAEISITAVQKTIQILPGSQTTVWSYEGQLLNGSGVTVQAIPGSYLGPILRVQNGKKLRLFFHNHLGEKTILHPHGLLVPEECDGQPMQAIDPGLTKVYEFQVINQAGPAWFHPHPMGRTAEQVVMGMAGLFYVWDPDEEKAVPGASSGANDIPVVIQDRTFTSDNQFLYQPNMMWGYLANRILVNGQPDIKLSLEPRAYRLRLLNGSNARTYKLAWSNALPLTVIGTDGGLLPAAVSRPYVMLMPGERIDLWADFSSLSGQQVTLRSLAFTPGGMGGMGMGMGRSGGAGMGMGGMGGMGMRNSNGMSGGMMMGTSSSMGMGDSMMMGSGLPNGTALDILNVTVGKTTTANPVLGPLPPLSIKYDASNVSNYASPRPFNLNMGMMMTWMINGRVYDPTAVADDEKVNLNEPMTWQWINNSPIPHPMHIHNVQFQVVERDPTSTPASYAEIKDGLVDSGWKDTVMVWPGERVKIAMMFGPYTGMYMYHCHILEHEDMTMMRNFVIRAPSASGM